MDTQETKLLSGYSDTEKGAYLAAIASLATVDEVASEEELEFLRLLSEAAELAPNTQQEVIMVAKDPRNLSLKKCLDVLKNSELRFSFITDLMSFAKADGQLDPEEEAKIQEMAQYLNINQQQYGTLQQFMHQAEEARQQGQNPLDQGYLEKSGAAASLGQSGIPMGSIMKGMLGMLAPMAIAGMLSRRGGMHVGMGGGLLGGLLGGVLGGGMMGMGSMGGFGGMMGYGGMVPLMGMIGSLGGRRGYRRGGLGSVLGGLFGGRRSGW